jgi:hypothetical protein
MEDSPPYGRGNVHAPGREAQRGGLSTWGGRGGYALPEPSALTLFDWRVEASVRYTEGIVH